MQTICSTPGCNSVVVQRRTGPRVTTCKVCRRSVARKSNRVRVARFRRLRKLAVEGTPMEGPELQESSVPSVDPIE
jgi:hypothetical protein